MKKTNLWKGLSSVCGMLFVFASALTSLGFDNAGAVNSYLNIVPPSATSNESEHTTYYQSSYGELSDASLAALIADEDAYNAQTMEEGSVLVKNDGALPLDVKSESKVTLFGRAVADPVYRGSSAGPDYDETRLVSLHDAMASAGFDVNETLYEAYAKSTTARVMGGEKSSIGEESISFYTGALKSSFSSYSDVAIVMLARDGGEGNDLAVSDADGVPQLSLHQQEKDLLNMIRDSGVFQKTIVLINSGYAMELDWLDEYGVDACLWIGGPGLTGFTGVANVLTGEANPSGHFTDTYATDSLSAPAMRNFGSFTYRNAREIDNYGSGMNTGNYVIQAEGIYTGYQYYETRYEDCILDRFNANSSAGAYASSGGWNYAEEMSYPFGYGLSYTTFEQTLDSVSVDSVNQTIAATVTVTNTGEVAGKSTVQLYAQLPYTEYDRQNLVEKSAVQLLDFAKTDALEPGESETITIVSDQYLLATYDENGAKGYIFDAGDYYLAIGDDAHDALNNILAAKGATGLYDHNGAPVAGNAEKTYRWTLSEMDTTTYRYSQYTGEEVTNRFDGNIDLNDWLPNTVTYLTRQDWTTYPQSYTSITASQDMIVALDGNTYQTPADAPSVKEFKQGGSSGLSFVEMKDVEFDDETTWNGFLNQLTVEELAQITADYWSTEAVLSVNKPASVNNDGPDGVKGNYQYGAKGSCTVYVNESVLACTWSKELLEKKGFFLAEDALFAGVSQLWSPGANLHRTPYSGRNFEYFSEDSIFTYHAAACVVKPMTEKGLIACIKHFAANDQETNRTGLSTFMTEQTYRQKALKGFEGAFTVGGTLGTMTSYNRIGCTAMSQDAASQKEVLRGEWGFRGVVITDAAMSNLYMHSAESLAGGSDMFCMSPTRNNDFVTLVNKKGDGYILQCLREANRHFYYAYSHSNLINGLTADSVVARFIPWWKPVLIVIDCALGLATLAFAGTFLLQVYGRRKGGKV